MPVPACVSFVELDKGRKVRIAIGYI